MKKVSEYIQNLKNFFNAVKEEFFDLKMPSIAETFSYYFAIIVFAGISAVFFFFIDTFAFKVMHFLIKLF